MNRPRNWWCIVALELAVAAYFVSQWLREPIPPRPDLSHYHPATAQAIRTLQDKVAETGSADDWLQLGKTYLLFGLFPEAEFCCSRATQLDAGSFDALYWRGVAFNQLGETSRAIESFRSALELAESETEMRDARARCWYGIGRNRLRQEEADQAEAAFRQAGDFVPARLQLARIFVRTGRSKESLKLLDELVTRFPRESVYYQLRARAKEQLGDARGAYDDRQRVERAPDRLRTDEITAQLQAEAGSEGLYAELREADRLLSRDPMAAVQRLRGLLAADWRSELAGLLIEAEMRIGNAQQAVDLLRQKMAREGTTAELLAQLADAYELLRQSDRAFATRKRAAELMSIPRVHDALNRAYASRGQFAEASRRRAMSRMARGIAAYRENRLPEAMTDLQRAVKLHADLASAWYYLGECHRVRGEPKKAVDSFRNCLKANPNHGRALVALRSTIGS